jgi:hypothetical protein
MGFVMGALTSREEKLMNRSGSELARMLVSVITLVHANNAAKISHRTNPLK